MSQEQASLEPLNALELTSILALMAYAAREQKVSEITVGAVVAANFDVGDVTQLPRQAYEDVVRFLVDTKIEMILN